MGLYQLTMSDSMHSLSRRNCFCHFCSTSLFIPSRKFPPFFYHLLCYIRFYDRSTISSENKVIDFFSTRQWQISLFSSSFYLFSFCWRIVLQWCTIIFDSRVQIFIFVSQLFLKNFKVTKKSSSKNSWNDNQIKKISMWLRLKFCPNVCLNDSQFATFHSLGFRWKMWHQIEKKI